jgi:sporulation protein YlmC with PRC-barrel domain
MDAAKLRTMAIVSVTEGSKLGYVDDVLFDAPALRVAALRARGDGQEFVVPFDRVRSVGADAVTVESSAVAQLANPGGAVSGLVGLERIKQLKVVDDAGTLLGTIQQIVIDPPSGRVTSLRVHRGGVLGLGGTTTTIDVRAIHSVGGEIMTVASGATGADAPGASAPSREAR